MAHFPVKVEFKIRLDRSTALSFLLPEPIKIAINSASDKALLPFNNSFSYMCQKLWFLTHRLAGNSSNLHGVIERYWKDIPSVPLLTDLQPLHSPLTDFEETTYFSAPDWQKGKFLMIKLKNPVTARSIFMDYP